MERLTYKENGKWRLRIGNIEFSGKEADRLAAYEDTGLAPEDCAAYKKFEANLCASDVPFSRIIELVNAEKEGRCVVLPCKVGDKAWYLTGKPSAARQPHFDRIDSEIAVGFYYDERGLQVRLNYFHGNHGTYGFFGKTVFLTREEAQAALKEREDRP